MLSPASLRVCCLAVMAPALTKADRRADCLTDVLSEPFCISKTAETFSGREKESLLNGARLYTKSSCPLLKRKSYFQKSCLRTTVKGGPVFLSKTRHDHNRAYFNSGVVRASTVVKNKTWQSTKVTHALVDKNRFKNTMNKNTTSVKNMGLAKANTSLGLQNLKMKKITHLSHVNKESSNVLHNSEPVLDVTESDSNFQSNVLEKTVYKKTQLPLDGDVEHGPEPENSLTFDCSASSTTAEDVNSSTVISNCNIPVSCSGDGTTSTSSDVTVNSVSLIRTENLPSENAVTLKDSSEQYECTSISLPLTTSNVAAVDTAAVLPTDSEMVVGSEPSCPVDANTNGGDLINYSVSNSLSMDTSDSHLPSHQKYPDSLFTSFMDTVSDTEYDTCSIFSGFKSRITNSDSSDCKCSLSTSDPTHACSKQDNICCILSSEELSSLDKLLKEREMKVRSALDQSQLLLRRHMNIHVIKQLRRFVDYYQKRLAIPCQRQATNVSLKPVKDPVDLKTELLQSEDVKNLSTAALVNLVRKLESSGPGKAVPVQDITQTSELELVENISAKFDLEDCVDVKRTSGVLLNTMKNVLKCTDPYLTDSSDDEYEVDIGKESLSGISSSRKKKALWKYLTERATLASRSTWLLVRIHELEYQLKGYGDRLKEICSSEGNVCFEESLHSSSLSVEAMDDIDLQSTAKHVTLKSLMRPMNGYLDHGPLSEAAHIVQTTNSWTYLSPTEADTESCQPEVFENSCSRTRPLKVPSFRKRKLVHTTGLHLTNKKLSRLSTINCYCNSQNVISPCILCTGRYNSVQSVDPDSMPLQDRIAILDPFFHPLLSMEKDIPLDVQFENVLKQTDAQYQNEQPTPTPVLSSQRRLHFGVNPKPFSDLRHHTRRLNRYARSYFSSKYRRKHLRNSKHLRKHRIVFGKWRRIHKNTFNARDHIRRLSVASSASSYDSPVPSPLSAHEDGYDFKKRRDDNQFDIDDVIIPCSSKSGRLVEIQYKEIVIPSWRYRDITEGDCYESEDIENISDEVFIRRHDRMEVEERKKLRSSALGLTALSRRGRRIRCDSRADSSGANTPDPVLMYNQDIMFQVPNSLLTANPSSPALSPPTTPSSTTMVSDDSQPSFGNGSATTRFERRKQAVLKRPAEDTYIRPIANDDDEVQPYEQHVFPLSDKEYEELLAESVQYKDDVYSSPISSHSCPASPESSTSSTSTVEDDDITDPEWTVVKRDSSDQALVLKFAKR